MPCLSSWPASPIDRPSEKCCSPSKSIDPIPTHPSYPPHPLHPNHHPTTHPRTQRGPNPRKPKQDVDPPKDRGAGGGVCQDAEEQGHQLPPRAHQGQAGQAPAGADRAAGRRRGQGRGGLRRGQVGRHARGPGGVPLGGEVDAADEADGHVLGGGRLRVYHADGHPWDAALPGGQDPGAWLRVCMCMFVWAGVA